MKIGAIEGGGTKFICAVGDELGMIIKKEIIPTTSPSETLNQVIAFFKENPVKAIGFGCFGPIDIDKTSPTYGELTTTPKQAWCHFNVLTYLKHILKCSIYLETDVNMAVLGETFFGKHHHLENVLYITIGTGVGVGAIIQGQLLSSSFHPEMGHVFITKLPNDNYLGGCLYHHNCLEGFISGPAIASQFGTNLPHDHEAWTLVGQYLAQAIITYTYTLIPQRIILGGGIGLIPKVLDECKKEVTRLNNHYMVNKYLVDIDTYIQRASLGDNAGILGCIAYVVKQEGIK